MIKLRYIDTKSNVADILTKAVGPQLFKTLLILMGICLTQSEREKYVSAAKRQKLDGAPSERECGDDARTAGNNYDL